jgi:hypothetical protein
MLPFAVTEPLVIANRDGVVNWTEHLVPFICRGRALPLPGERLAASPSRLRGARGRSQMIRIQRREHSRSDASSGVGMTKAIEKAPDAKQGSAKGTRAVAM